ncbi:hypothetical protein F3Y22_tig00008386pilonHSYRG00111 [Hibiscus syriacus]|uniref:POX domain-containing protein n=1 Tax=Hibiscus syriacus TaxID=106335 RepID=A0A6A3C8N1_HIBSY|nr:hypothetical protein F3Y22_tig00008386pilonHSYRG00111 [Hibiscus syriacus]
MLAMHPMAGASGTVHGGQGLSLSLCTQIPSGIQIPYRNSGFSFSGGNQDSNKGELSAYGVSTMSRTIPNSKYLKAAQQLLDEVVNVQKALKQPYGGKIETHRKTGRRVLMKTGARRMCRKASKNPP